MFRVLHGDLGKRTFAPREHWDHAQTVLSCSSMAQRCPSCSACLLEPEPHTAVLLNCTSHHFDARTPQFHVISDILFLTACFRLIFKQLNSTCYIDLQPSELIFDYFFKRSPSCTISRSHFVAVVAESVDEKYPTELGAGRLGSGSCAGR